VQVSPTIWQVPVPGVVAQKPPVQTVEQHCDPAVQALPVAPQALPLHVPPEQLPVQHSRLELQSVPLALQNGLAHLPAVHVPEQQSEGKVQLLYAVRQVVDVLGWQVPLLQLPVQHCAAPVQVVPLAKQVPLGWQVVVVAPAQKVEQHGVPLPTAQVAPLARQALAWQLPPTQMLEQQSTGVLQVVPLPAQFVAWQVPLVQNVEQHWEPALQLAPLAEQVPPLVVVEDLEQPWARRATAAVAKSREARRRMDGPSIHPARRNLGGLGYTTIRPRPPFRQRSHRPTFPAPWRSVPPDRSPAPKGRRVLPTPPPGRSETPQGARPQDVGQCP
jgi:hypothetical protein